MSAIPFGRFRVAVLATGGTIEKTYDPRRGELSLAVPVLDALLATLELTDMQVSVERVMAKDSLDMTSADRDVLLDTVRGHLAGRASDALLVTHGTDTLADTAVLLARALDAPDRPVILTGAMRPFRVANSDAAQNVAQALMAARLIAPGVYVVCHGAVVPADRVVKDYDRLTLTATPAES